MMTQEQTEAYQELFDHMFDKYSLALVQSELDEIIMISLRVVERFNKLNE